MVTRPIETIEELIEQHEEAEPQVDPVARAMLTKCDRWRPYCIRCDGAPCGYRCRRSVHRPEDIEPDRRGSALPDAVYRNRRPLVGMIHIKDMMALWLLGSVRYPDSAEDIVRGAVCGARPFCKCASNAFMALVVVSMARSTV